MVTFRTDMMGTIYVTDDIGFVRAVPDGTVKIISLDEDGSLNPNDPNVIIGTCLLPPIEALIAENDGDEDLYTMQYVSYLNTPAIQIFISAIIGALYKQQSLLLYAPQLRTTNSITKFIQLMWELYGINIGIVGQQGSVCSYDPRCIPIWMNMLYSANIIDLIEFLYNYPENVIINDPIMNKIISELKPVGRTYNERIEAVQEFRERLKKNPNTIYPIYDTRSYDALLW